MRLTPANPAKHVAFHRADHNGRLMKPCTGQLINSNLVKGPSGPDPCQTNHAQPVSLKPVVGSASESEVMAP